MTREELREKVAKAICSEDLKAAPFDVSDIWVGHLGMADAAIRVVLEAAIEVSDLGPHGRHANLIRALMPEDQDG